MANDDLISRQAAIDAICEHGVDLERRGITVLAVVNHKQVTVDLLEKLPSAERWGRWIPITERLPEDEGQYLVSCDNDYGVEIGRFYIDEDGERYFGCDWNDPDDIKAWMPLPEPYKDGGEE